MLSEQKRETMLARVLRLANVYGPFVRFYPEGNEGDGGSAIEDGEKAELENNEEFEKTRQRADQEAANAAKARERATQAESENETLKEQLVAAKAKADEAGIEDVELDESNYQDTDLALVKSIKALNKKIDAKDSRIAGLEKKAAGYEEQLQKEANETARNSIYEGLLTDLDLEYGADCRNEAVNKFQTLNTEGKVPKGNPTKATRIMEKCYKEVKAAKAANKKDKPLSLDSGSGGGSALNLSSVEIKEGSLDEVAAQYAAAAPKS